MRDDCVYRSASFLESVGQRNEDLQKMLKMHFGQESYMQSITDDILQKIYELLKFTVKLYVGVVTGCEQPNVPLYGFAISFSEPKTFQPEWAETLPDYLLKGLEEEHYVKKVFRCPSIVPEKFQDEMHRLGFDMTREGKKREELNQVSNSLKENKQITSAHLKVALDRSIHRVETRVQAIMSHIGSGFIPFDISSLNLDESDKEKYQAKQIELENKWEKTYMPAFRTIPKDGINTIPYDHDKLGLIMYVLQKGVTYHDSPVPAFPEDASMICIATKDENRGMDSDWRANYMDVIMDDIRGRLETFRQELPSDTHWTLDENISGNEGFIDFFGPVKGTYDLHEFSITGILRPNVLSKEMTTKLKRLISDPQTK